MCYLKARERLFRFTIREEYFPLRKEYNDYCRWVAGRLSNVRFGYDCQRIEYNTQKDLYFVQVINKERGCIERYWTRNVVIGVGTVPWTPEYEGLQPESVFHSADYLHKKHLLKDKERITIIGSGQSAAEIFSDLLEPCFYQGKKLHWFTRSNRFYPMDYSKFALEMTSPDYINHFFDLPSNIKQRVLKTQSSLYKGMNTALIDSIYNRLYILSLEEGFRERIFLQANSKLVKIKGVGEALKCTIRNKETRRSMQHNTDALIMATGYQSVIPQFIQPIRERICWDKAGRYAVRRNYSIDENNTIFVQNAELHTHGFNAPDLGMGPYRNAIILNTVLGYSHFQIERDVPFQRFG